MFVIGGLIVILYKCDFNCTLLFSMDVAMPYVCYQRLIPPPCMPMPGGVVHPPHSFLKNPQQEVKAVVSDHLVAH